MRTPEQRGRYGRWLVTSREGRGYDTAQKALDALSAVGIRIGKSTYAEYEAGTKAPSRNHLPELERFWGPVPVDEAPSGDLATALQALARELEATRLQRERMEVEFGVLKALVGELLAERQPGLAPEGEAAPDAPPVTAGSGR